MKKIILSIFISFILVLNTNAETFDYYYQDYWNKIDMNRYADQLREDTKELEKKLEEVKKENKEKELEKMYLDKIDGLENEIKNINSNLTNNTYTTINIVNESIDESDKYYKLGEAEYKEGNYKKAIGYYKLSYANNNGDSSMTKIKLYASYSDLALEYFSVKDYEKALNNIEIGINWLPIKVENNTFRYNHYRGVYNYQWGLSIDEVDNKKIQLALSYLKQSNEIIKNYRIKLISIRKQLLENTYNGDPNGDKVFNIINHTYEINDDMDSFEKTNNKYIHLIGTYKTIACGKGLALDDNWECVKKEQTYDEYIKSLSSEKSKYYHHFNGKYNSLFKNMSNEKLKKLEEKIDILINNFYNNNNKNLSIVKKDKGIAMLLGLKQVITFTLVFR